MGGVTASSAQGAEPGRDVEGLRIVGRHAGEQVTGAWDVAGPFVQVGEGIPLAEVMLLGPLAGRPWLLEQPDRARDVAAVGQAAGRDDAALGDRLGAGRRFAEVLP